MADTLTPEAPAATPPATPTPQTEVASGGGIVPPDVMAPSATSPEPHQEPDATIPGIQAAGTPTEQPQQGGPFATEIANNDLAASVAKGEANVAQNQDTQPFDTTALAASLNPAPTEAPAPDAVSGNPLPEQAQPVVVGGATPDATTAPATKSGWRRFWPF